MAYVLSEDTEADLQCQEEVMDKLLFPCSGKAGLFWLSVRGQAIMQET